MHHPFAFLVLVHHVGRCFKSLSEKALRIAFSTASATPWWRGCAPRGRRGGCAHAYSFPDLPFLPLFRPIGDPCEKHGKENGERKIKAAAGHTRPVLPRIWGLSWFARTTSVYVSIYKHYGSPKVPRIIPQTLALFRGFPGFSRDVALKRPERGFFAAPNSAAKRPLVAFCRNLSAESAFSPPRLSIRATLVRGRCAVPLDIRHSFDIRHSIIPATNCHSWLCKHQYVEDSNYRASRKRSATRPWVILSLSALKVDSLGLTANCTRTHGSSPERKSSMRKELNIASTTESSRPASSSLQR